MIPFLSRRSPAALAAVLLVVPLLAPAAERRAPEVERALAAIVDGSPLARARAGILAVDAETGEVVYARDPDALLNPASNVKLVTSAAALARLGPEYRFDTEFLVDAGAPAAPAVKTLYVRGKGDPDRRHRAALRHRRRPRAPRAPARRRDRGGRRLLRRGAGRPWLRPGGAATTPTWRRPARSRSTTTRSRSSCGRARGAARGAWWSSTRRATTSSSRTAPSRWPAGARRVKVSAVLQRGRQRIVVEGRVPLGSRPQAVWRRIDDPAGLLRGHAGAPARAARREGGAGPGRRGALRRAARARGRVRHARRDRAAAQQDLQQLRRRAAPQDARRRDQRRAGQLVEGGRGGGGASSPSVGHPARQLRDEERLGAERHEPLQRAAARDPAPRHVVALPAPGRVRGLAAGGGARRHHPLADGGHRGRRPAPRQDRHARQRDQPLRLRGGRRAPDGSPSRCW